MFSKLCKFSKIVMYLNSCSMDLGRDKYCSNLDKYFIICFLSLPLSFFFSSDSISVFIHTSSLTSLSSSFKHATVARLKVSMGVAWCGLVRPASCASRWCVNFGWVLSLISGASQW